MSELGDLLADRLAKHDPETAARMGIRPLKGLESDPDMAKKAEEAQAEQRRIQEAFGYAQTIARLSERFYTAGASLDSAVGKAVEFVDYMNRWTEQYMKRCGIEAQIIDPTKREGVAIGETTNGNGGNA